MVNRFTVAILALILGSAFTPRSTHAQLAAPGECYGTTGTKFPAPNSDLVTVDTTNGATVTVGTAVGYLALSGLAIDSKGKLFAVHASGGSSAGQDANLYRIDATMAVPPAVVTPLVGGAGQFLRGLAFNNDDVLYSIKGAGVGTTLVTIDTTNGAVNPVLVLGRNFSGLAFDRETGLLYASVGGNAVAADLNAIYVIDLSAPSITKLGNLIAAAGGVPAIFFDRTGDFYAIQNPHVAGVPAPSGNAYTVNKATGVGNLLGANAHRVIAADCYNRPSGPPPPTAIQVDVDIYPEEACPSVFNVMSRGRLVLSIQGTADFDATTIDPATVTLAGVSPVLAVFEDTSRPAGDAECACTEDGPDGIVDLKLHFWQQDVLAAIGPVEDGDVVAIPLTGLTTDGEDIEGEDCVIIEAPGENSAGKFDEVTPTEFQLAQNYPNPFNPTTTLTISVPTESQVDLVIYNSMGQEITRVVSGVLAAGSHTVQWDATDALGRAVPSGTYLYRLTAGDFVQTRSMMLLK
ncbi:MAG TPA: FlgD immunoglobulin-like domain containing protein [Rhodothermales bacterium]|nr:FlgD immunoglobulin-like domain containing protein [Rhodothermales bacterium]